MTEFRLEKKLPPCKVTKGLLESLEKYILNKKEKIEEDMGEPPNRSDLTITITDNLGEESINSTQLLNERFFPSTTEVAINFYAYWYEKDSLQISINFSSKSYRKSAITIKSESISARELVIGMYNSLDEIIEPNKTLERFFHPPEWLGFVIFMISLAAIFIGFLAEFIAGIKYAFGRGILLSATGFGYLYICLKLHPHTTFDSPIADRLKSISRVCNGILLTFLFSFIVFPFIARILFGQ